MDARTLEGPVAVLKERSPDAEVVAKIGRDTEVTLGKTSGRGGRKWLQVTLYGGATGWIPAETRLFRIQEHRVDQPKADIYERPTGAARVTRRLAAGDRVFVTGEAEGGGESWVRIRDNRGAQGFLPRDTRLTPLGGGFLRRLFGR